LLLCGSQDKSQNTKNKSSGTLTNTPTSGTTKNDYFYFAAIG
jgi:hypothetical protein